MGAIGECLPRGVFSLARSTNRDAVMDFLKKLRSTVDPDPMMPKEQQKQLVMVLDNHTAHKTVEVVGLAAQLKIELLFLPPYCPELNSIESLWSVVKNRIKTCLLEHQY